MRSPLILSFVFVLAVSCGTSSTTSCEGCPQEIADETGYIEHDSEVEAGAASDARVDLRIDSTITKNGERYLVEASITSMDTSQVAMPEISVVLSRGVHVEELPVKCVAGQDAFVCTYPDLFSGSVPHSSDPINFTVTVVDGAVDPWVTLIGRSFENPVSNDPNPGDNIVMHVLD